MAEDLVSAAAAIPDKSLTATGASAGVGSVGGARFAGGRFIDTPMPSPGLAGQPQGATGVATKSGAALTTSAKSGSDAVLAAKPAGAMVAGKAGTGACSGAMAAGKSGGGMVVAAGKGKLLLFVLLLFPLTPLLLFIAVISRRGRKKNLPVAQKPLIGKRKTNMMKLIGARAVPIFLALVSLVVAVAGCAAVYKKLRTERITIAAGYARGESYVLMQALKTVVERHHPRLKITVNDTGGTLDSLQRLEHGDAQIVAVQADVPASARALEMAVLYLDTFQLIVHKAPKGRPGSIKQFAELKGTKIAAPPNSGQYRAFLFLAAHFGLKESDFTPEGGDEVTSIDAFRRNEADASFQMRSVHNPEISKMVTGEGDGVFLPIEDAVAIHEESPGDISAIIPKGAYQGNPAVPPVDIPTLATERLLMARDDADQDAIQYLTQVLMENRQEIASAIPESDKPVRALVGEIAQPPARTGLGPPTHPGALAYYNRAPSTFTGAHADALSLAAAAFILFWLWVWGLRRATGLSQKTLVDSYNHRMLQLMEEARSAEDERDLAPIEKELAAMMSTAILDLNENKLSDFSFQSFHTIWKVSRDAVLERKTVLMPVTGTPHGNIPIEEAKSRWNFSDLLMQKTRRLGASAGKHQI